MTLEAVIRIVKLLATIVYYEMANSLEKGGSVERTGVNWGDNSPHAKFVRKFTRRQ